MFSPVLWYINLIHQTQVYIQWAQEYYVGHPSLAPLVVLVLCEGYDKTLFMNRLAWLAIFC